MKYYAIKTPANPPVVWWISDSEHGAWQAFFTWPSKNNQFSYGRPPLAEAIQAYEAIGYRCVEVLLTEVL